MKGNGEEGMIDKKQKATYSDKCLPYYQCWSELGRDQYLPFQFNLNFSKMENKVFDKEQQGVTRFRPPDKQQVIFVQKNYLFYKPHTY